MVDTKDDGSRSAEEDPFAATKTGVTAVVKRLPWSAVRDDRLAPPPGAPARAEYVRWLVLATTALQPAVVEALLARETGNEAALETAKETFRRHAGTVERALDARNADHLIGDQLTAADVLVGSVLTWAASLGLVEPSARVAEYAKKVAGALG